MKRIRALAALLTLGIAVPAAAQTFSLYKIQTEDLKQIQSVSKNYEIVSHEGKNLFHVYVPHEKETDFKSIAPTSELLLPDADSDWRETFAKNAEFASGYHTWQSIQDYMNNAAQTYPELVSINSYGASQQGYKLSYLRISSSKTGNGVKPKIFLDAATHGDELISTEVLLTLVDELLKGYGTDNRLKQMIDKTDIYVAFVVNPDGYVKQQRYDNGVDPNRSYPWPGDPNHKPTASIQALMNLFASEKFTGSITLHAYGRLLMYPWAYTEEPLSNETDRANFETLTNKLSAENGYTHGPIATTIYVAEGSSADYYYWKFHTEALAVELSTNKVPSPSKIPAVVNEAREMVWGFIEHYYQ
ncbi:MAG: hypothetical protein H7249_15910 [Chitinophagaceae bacterium]|nr:hypothetical protein [Oligoflexus sp.]